MDQYTASRIHEILCQADGLDPTEQPALLNRIRYLAKRGLLRNGRRVDDRGTLAYRAVLFADRVKPDLTAKGVHIAWFLALARERQAPLDVRSRAPDQEPPLGSSPLPSTRG